VAGFRELFLDAVAVPSSVTLRLGDNEFSEIANEIFGFHDAEVLSSLLDLAGRRLEFVLSYIVSQEATESGLLRRRWRELSLTCEGLIEIEFVYEDSEFGRPHQTRRLIYLEGEDRRDAFHRIRRALWQDHSGAVLNRVNFEKSTQEFEGTELPLYRRARIRFEWLTSKGQSILIENGLCRNVELRFLGPASDLP
jgi:hypothetical protein